MLQGIPVPTQWPRTFSVLGIGMGTIVFLNQATFGQLFFYFSSMNSFPEDPMPQSLMAFNFFALVFVSYVVGEFFCIIGTGITKKSSFYLKRHAIVLFCAQDETGFWKTKLLEAERRYELFCGLRSCSFILSLALAANLAFEENLIASVLTVIGGLILTFLASLLAMDSFGELEKTLSNTSELKRENDAD